MRVKFANLHETGMHNAANMFILSSTYIAGFVSSMHFPSDI